MTFMKQYNAITSLKTILCGFTGKCMFDGFIHSTKCNKKEEIYKDKQFLHGRRKMCERMKILIRYFKDNTDRIPHLHLLWGKYVDLRKVFIK